MSATSSRRRPSAATLIAAVALFVALGGTAQALHGHNKVRSDDIVNHSIVGHDIANNAIKSPNIKNGNVTPNKTQFVHTSSLATASATTASSPTDLGGPNVTVSVPNGGVIEVFAQADISSVGGGQNAVGRVTLYEPHLLATPQSLMASGSNSFQTRRSSPGSNDSDGTIALTRGGWITLLAPPGSYTFSLRYQEDGGGTATFQNRLLAVRVTA
jgi:hypothetical protein